MSFFKDLREKLGLTQKEMAAYLEIPRSTYSLVEIRKRSFTTKALLKAGYFEIAIASEKFQQAAVHDIEDVQNGQSSFCEMLKQRIKDCKFAQLTLERKKKDIIKNYNAAENLLKLTTVFFEIYPERREVKRDHKWMDIFSELAKIRYNENRLLLMELELDTHKLKCEMEKAMEMLAGITQLI